MTLAVHSERKVSGKSLAAVVHSDAVETRWAKWSNRLRALAAPGSSCKLGPWQALESALTFSERIEQRLSVRIDALEAEVAGLRGEAPPENSAPTGEGERIELQLRGEVTRSNCDALVAKINKAAPRSEIVLKLTTNGGDHDASVDLAQALLEHKGPVRTIAEGKCHSAGVTIFMAGARDARLASQDAEFLIHAGSFERLPAYWTQEFARGVESAQSDYLAKLFSRRTGKSWFSFRAMMRTTEGKTLSAARAHELGIVSDILPARTRVRRSAKSKRKAKSK